MKTLLAALVVIFGFCASVHAQQSTTVTLTFDAGSGIASGTSVTLISFKLGAHQAGLLGQVGGIATASKSQFTPITVFKSVDQFSPALFIACATGKHIKEATITMSNNGDAPFFQVVLGNVYVSAVDDDSTNSGGEVPVESISLNYSKIGWEYTPASGPSVQSGFDVLRNVSIGFDSIAGLPR